jgi:hypothetical protein
MKAKKLIIAFAVAAIAAPAALAGTDTGIGIPAGRDSVSSPAPIVSEKTAGLWQPQQQSSPLVSEKTAGLWRAPAPVSSVSVLAAPDNRFDWSDAGIGAGVTFGSLLLASAGAFAVRRRNVLAH